MNEYRPVDCAVYGRFELAILRRQRLSLRWRGTDGLVHFGICRPQDLETLQGAEFLHATAPDGSPLRIRLDRILSVTVAG